MLSAPPIYMNLTTGAVALLHVVQINAPSNLCVLLGQTCCSKRENRGPKGKQAADADPVLPICEHRLTATTAQLEQQTR